MRTKERKSRRRRRRRRTCQRLDQASATVFSLNLASPNVAATNVDLSASSSATHDQRQHETTAEGHTRGIFERQQKRGGCRHVADETPSHACVCPSVLEPE